MGADMFITFQRGQDVKSAFKAARKQALQDHGRGGYSGTLAEKDSFVEIPIPSDFMPKEKDLQKRGEKWAESLFAANDKRIDDKWGPAGAAFVGDSKPEKVFMFFGWASK